MAHVQTRRPAASFEPVECEYAACKDTSIQFKLHQTTEQRTYKDIDLDIICKLC